MRLELVLGDGVRVVAHYAPWRPGSQRGHPDDWTEPEPADFELERATCAGVSVELSPDELEEARSEAAEAYEDARHDGPLSRLDDPDEDWTARRFW